MRPRVRFGLLRAVNRHADRQPRTAQALAKEEAVAQRQYTTASDGSEQPLQSICIVFYPSFRRSERSYIYLGAAID